MKPFTSRSPVRCTFFTTCIRVVFIIWLLPFQLRVLAQQPEWVTALERSELLIKSSPDSAFVLLKELVTAARQKNAPLAEASCLQQIGIIFYNYGYYSQAVDHLMQAEKIFRREKVKEKLARNLNLLGRVYYANKQPDLAGRLFSEALQLNIEAGNTKEISFTYGNIGHLYEKKLAYDSAFWYQQQALHILQRAGDNTSRAKIFENLGSIYEDMKRFDSARHYFELALLTNRQYGDYVAMIEVLNNLGDVNRKTGRYSEGLGYTRQAMQLAQKMQSKNQLASAYRDMARGFERLNNPDSAYYYNELSRGLIEEIYSASNNQQIALLEIMYEVDMKDSQIAKLALDKKVNITITVAGIIVILSLITLGMAIISRQRLKISKEKAINQQNRELYEKDHELMETALRNKHLEEEKLKSTLEMRHRELSTYTLHLIQKNQLLEELRTGLNEIVKDEKRDQRKPLKRLVQQINQNFTNDSYWDNFRAIFDQVHHSFFVNLKKHAENLTPAELKIAALLRMNLNSGDMATLLGISQDSLRVARYRLRKKLHLGESESLTAFIQGL